MLKIKGKMNFSKKIFRISIPAKVGMEYAKS